MMMDETNAWWIAVAVLGLLYATPAAAGHGDGEIAFDELEASVTDADQLRLEYEVDAGDWHRLDRPGVHPELNVYTKYEEGGALRYAYNFDLESRSGSFTLPSEIDAEDLEQFQIEVLGFDESWRVRSLAAGGVSGGRLVFARSSGGFSIGAVSVGSSRPSGDDTSVAVGGSESDEDDENESSDDDGSDDSETAASSVDSEWKARTISACNEATTYDSDMKACTKYALDIEPKWAKATVEACDEAFTYRSDFKKCLMAARDYDAHDPAEAIETCASVSSYTSAKQKCISDGASYSSNPVPVIEACDAATTYKSDRKKCIELGDQLGSGGAEIIRACSGNSIESCIENAAR